MPQQFSGILEIDQRSFGFVRSISTILTQTPSDPYVPAALISRLNLRTGVLIGAPLGILLGIAAALHRNTWIDYLVSAFSTLGLTIPVFVISMILIMLFAPDGLLRRHLLSDLKRAVSRNPAEEEAP